jgi:hypothetical protein
MLDDVIQLYSNDSALPLRTIKVEFIGEPGDDFGGLTKDLLTSIWVFLINDYFRGESAVVPHLPLYKHAEHRQDFVAIGRILTHTVALLKTVPARLSRCTLMYLAFGSTQIAEDLLIDDFRLVFAFIGSMFN